MAVQAILVNAQGNLGNKDYKTVIFSISAGRCMSPACLLF